MQLRQKVQFVSVQRLYLPIGLSTLALASLLGITPSVAATQISSQTPVNDSETVVAGLFEDIVDTGRTIFNGDINDVDDVINAIDEVQQLFERRAFEQRAEEERQLRELERIRLQEEREAAAQAAAEQRRQYYESLTPEQQQAYVQEQQHRQQQQVDVIYPIFLEMLFSTFTQPDQGDYPQGMSEDEYYCYLNPNCGR